MYHKLGQRRQVLPAVLVRGIAATMHFLTVAFQGRLSRFLGEGWWVILLGWMVCAQPHVRGVCPF